MDYSRAANLVDTDGHLQTGYEQSKINRVNKLAQELEFPSDVEPGTSNMLFYKNRNERILLEREKKTAEAINQVFDKRKEEVIQNLEVLNSMLGKIMVETLESKNLGKTGNPSATETVPFATNLIKHYEKLKASGKLTAHIPMDVTNKEYSTTYLLAMAQNLQNRLLEEARISGTK